MASPAQQLKSLLQADGRIKAEVHYPRGAHLHRAGSRDGDMYLILDGAVRTYVILDGEEQTIRFGYSGDIMAAIDCFATGQPTCLSTQTLRASTISTIPKQIHDDLLATNPQYAEVWHSVLPWMIVGQLEREVDLLCSSPAERYQRVLTRSPQLFQEVPARYIANYLRMSPETLSRLKKS
jgi:CRP-like cAMP-binding protein